MVDAYLDHMLEVGSPPSAAELVQRSGISQATYFRYFPSNDDMRHEAFTRIQERFHHLMEIADEGVGSFPERVASLVSSRLAQYDEIHSLMLGARALATVDTIAAAIVDRNRTSSVEQIRRHFAPELQRRTPARRDDAALTVATLTSVEAWHQLRDTHGRSTAQISRAWRSAVTTVLDD